MSAALNEAHGLSRASGVSQAHGDIMSLGTSGSDATSVQDRRAAAESLAHELGISDVSVADSVLTARLGGTLPKGWSPIIGAVDNAGSQRTANQIQAAVSNAERSLREKALSHQAQALTSFMNSDEFRTLRQSHQEAAHRLESAYQDYKSTRSTYSSEQREAEQYQEVARRAEVFAKTYTWNDVTRFNEFLKARGHLGSIDRDTVTADFKAFLMSGGIASDGKGKEFWIAYDGTRPTFTNLRSETHNSVVSDDRTFAANTSEDAFSRETVTDAAAANDHRVRQAASRTGVSAQQTVGADGLPQKIDTEKTAVADKIGGAAVDIEKGSRRNVEQFKDAKENVPWWHKLGEQLDGRSASQQLNRSKEPPSRGESGEW
jgi:hypothetical protein